jgi:predicted ATPase
LKESGCFFAGVDLLTKFASQVSDEGSQVKLALLSLEAGKKAELKSAFIPATNYLLGGIALLDPTNRWTEHYELCLELHIKAAEVGRTYGDFHETLALVKEVLAHGRCLKDRLRALLIKAYVLAGQYKLLEAIDTCKGALKQLRIRLPSNPKTFDVLFEYARTRRLLKGRKAHDLLSLPRTSDEMNIEAMRFLNAASIFAWHANLETVASFVFLRMMRLTLKNGLCKFSPFAFATFGMLLAAIGVHKEGYEFGRVALELHDHLEDSRECIASTTAVVESCLTHLKKPLYDSLAPMLESHQIGMQTGEIEFAALCLSGHGGLSIVLGAKLENMETVLLNYGTSV